MVIVGNTLGRGAHSMFAVLVTALWLLVALMLGTLMIPAAAKGASTGDPTSSTTDALDAAPVTISYGTGSSQYYLAWLPPQPTTRTAVALLHGGFWISGSPSATAPLNRKLYEAGIPSFSIGYRLATSAKWPAQRTDTQAALDDIKRRAGEFEIDPRSVALIGSSAGGQIALSIASGMGRADICAAVTYSAPTSMNVVRADGAGDYRRQMLATASTKLAPTAKLTRSATVPYTPSRTDAPTMLFAGQSEWMPYRQSSLYVQAYKDTGLEVRPVILSGVSEHAMKYALSQPIVWRLTMEFIDKHC